MTMDGDEQDQRAWEGAEQAPATGTHYEAPNPSGEANRAAAPVNDQDDLAAWRTENLPSDYFQPGLVPPPVVRSASPGRFARLRRPLLIALIIVVLVALSGGGVFAYLRQTTHQPPAAKHSGCEVGTPCQVADAFLAAYASGNYTAMYQQTSAESQKRFSDHAILGTNFTDARDYVVNRTSGILTEARVFSLSYTSQPVKLTSTTTATVEAQVVMQSTHLGTFTQNITIPLVAEKGKWGVQWSPGLIFPQLDDPSADPTYKRKIHLFASNGQRGTILDRDGNVLAKDDTVYVVGVVPGQIKDEGRVLQAISSTLDFSADQVKAKYQGHAATDFVAIRTVAPQLYQQVQGVLNPVPGIVVQTGMGRVYPYGEDAAPVTGYISPASNDDVKNDPKHYYESGDVVGRAGVEAWGEQNLRPTKGGKLEIVDVNADGSLGHPTYTIAARDPVNGADIHTTMQATVQQAAMLRLSQADGHSGGTMAVSPTTGEVLALGSFPFYDPNNFSLGFTPNAYDRFNALDHPYINRALASAQPTGSVFKVVTLAAALENGVAPTDTFTCPGSYQVPGEDHVRADDQALGHGTLTAADAIGPSCDVVFWKVAVLLNTKDPLLLPNMARSLGLGKPTGIVGILPGEEVAGLVPDPQYLKQTRNAGWTPTDATNLATGQGFLEVTPAQAAMASAALGNDGKLVQPRLVSSVVGSDGRAIASYGLVPVANVPISATNLKIIQTAMLGPIYSPTGTTARDFVNYPVHVAGKTGTAESGQANPHSWFICYAPASQVSGPPVIPQIAIGALVEYSDYGERYAVPVSKSIMNAFFHVQG